jgi:hypothetical protein
MFLRNLIPLFATLLVLAGCSALLPVNRVTGSGHPATQTFAFSGFDSLVISSAFQAEIIAADTYQVEVTVDDNLVEQLQVEQRGKTVQIGLAPHLSVGNATLHARITLPALAGLDANGAAHAQLTGFTSGLNTHINLSGASIVRGDLQTGDLTVDVSAGSNLTLSGSGNTLYATASGASITDLHDFIVNDADVNADGASRIEVNVSGKLNANASGAAVVQYSGDPTLGRIDRSGAGSVSRR